MSLTKDDLKALKKLFDSSFDKRVPGIIDERMSKVIDERVPAIVDKQIEKHMQQFRIEISQFSLETTKRIDALDKKLSDKIDDFGYKLTETTEMADTNRVEIAKIKRKIGMT